MAVTELLIIALAIVAAFLVARQAPGVADNILLARQVLFGIAAIIIALILVATGDPVAMVIGLLALFIAGLWLFRTRPDEEVF